MNAGLRAVFLMRRPMGSPVKPGKVKSVLYPVARVQCSSTFSRQPSIVHRHYVNRIYQSSYLGCSPLISHSGTIGMKVRQRNYEEEKRDPSRL